MFCFNLISFFFNSNEKKNVILFFVKNKSKSLTKNGINEFKFCNVFLCHEFLRKLLKCIYKQDGSINRKKED